MYVCGTSIIVLRVRRHMHMYLVLVPGEIPRYVLPGTSTRVLCKHAHAAVLAQSYSRHTILHVCMVCKMKELQGFRVLFVISGGSEIAHIPHRICIIATTLFILYAIRGSVIESENFRFFLALFLVVSLAGTPEARVASIVTLDPKTT